MSTFAKHGTTLPRRRGAGGWLEPAAVGLAGAAGLFLALAALQPAGIDEDDARLTPVWGPVHAVHLPAPPPRPPDKTPVKPPPEPLRRMPLPTPQASLPTPPRPATLHTRPATPTIDPLLQSIALSPAGIDAGGIGLPADASATALTAAGGDSWLGAVDSRALAALTRLHGHYSARPLRNEANRKPQWLQRVDPEYPPEALRRNQEGTVSLRLRVDVKGRVVDAEVLDQLAGYGFAQAAVAAARASTFIPGTDAAGEPVEQWILVSYLFQLK